MTRGSAVLTADRDWPGHGRWWKGTSLGCRGWFYWAGPSLECCCCCCWCSGWEEPSGVTKEQWVAGNGQRRQFSTWDVWGRLFFFPKCSVDMRFPGTSEEQFSQLNVTSVSGCRTSPDGYQIRCWNILNNLKMFCFLLWQCWLCPTY